MRRTKPRATPTKRHITWILLLCAAAVLLLSYHVLNQQWAGGHNAAADAPPSSGGPARSSSAGSGGAVLAVAADTAVGKPGVDALWRLLPRAQAERWVVNMGCGAAGKDVLSELLAARANNSTGVRGLYADPQPCKLPVDNLVYVKKALAPPEVVAHMGAMALPRQGWVVKIDIDSFDCEVGAAVVGKYKPAAVIIETMGCFPPPVRFSLVNTSACLSHACQMEQEKRWPNNCCLYSCSSQYALDAITPHGYVFWGFEAGDTWLLRADLAPATRALSDADIITLWLNPAAGMISKYNLHRTIIITKWSGWVYKRSYGKLAASVCRLLKRRCSAQRLGQSKWVLELGNRDVCSW